MAHSIRIVFGVTWFIGMLDGSITMRDVYLLDHQNRESMNPEFYHCSRMIKLFNHGYLLLYLNTCLLRCMIKFSMLIWQRLQSRFMNASLARSMELKSVLQLISKTET